MKIAIAAILGTIGGPRTYACNLIKALSKIDKENEYFILTDNTEPLIAIEGLQNQNLIKSSIFNLQFPIFGLYDVDLYHNTKNVLPLFSCIKSVVTIHDMALFLFPESFTA